MHILGNPKTKKVVVVRKVIVKKKPDQKGQPCKHFKDKPLSLLLHPFV